MAEVNYFWLNCSVLAGAPFKLEIVNLTSTKGFGIRGYFLLTVHMLASSVEGLPIVPGACLLC